MSKSVIIDAVRSPIGVKNGSMIGIRPDDLTAQVVQGLLDRNQEIPEMELNNKYSDKKPVVPENPEKVQKEMEKTKKELEKLKSFIVKNYSYVQAISILPPLSVKRFIEEELDDQPTYHRTTVCSHTSKVRSHQNEQTCSGKNGLTPA